MWRRDEKRDTQSPHARTISEPIDTAGAASEGAVTISEIPEPERAAKVPTGLSTTGAAVGGGLDRKPSGDSSFDRTVAAAYKTLAAFATTAAGEFSASLDVQRPTGRTSAAHRALAEWHGMRERPERRIDAGFTMGEVLGAGAMGIVREAKQLSLERAVAVKTLRDRSIDEEAIVGMLQEAWMTGLVEHPNVVPVYDIGVTNDDRPLIVLKRIEGTTWQKLANDAQAVHDRFGATDLVAWNLGVLMQVCNAVHFAHSRGVIHRDLKLENVMIGAFGEVYVVDWGVAISSREDPSGRLPVVRTSTDVAGTPCYMAPEMLGPGYGKIGAHSDVYLLGGILYELLTGSPPHDGDSLAKIVRQILLSDPRRPDAAPEDLADLALRALSADPTKRPASADAFRREIEQHLSRRGVLRLLDGAARSLAKLERLLEASAGHAGGADESARATMRRDLYRAFSEARFAYRLVLKDAPTEHAAVAGLSRAIERMVRFELADGQVEAAHALLEEMPKAAPELREAVEHARADRARQRAEEREHADRGRNFDPSIGGHARRNIGIQLALLWTILTAAMGPLVTDHAYELFLVPLVNITAGSLFVAIVLYRKRRVLMTTAFNRGALGAIAVAPASSAVLHLIATRIEMSAAEELALDALLFAVAASFAAIMVSRALWVAAASYLAAMALLLLFPEQRYFLFAGANLGLTISMVLLPVRSAVKIIEPRARSSNR